ncbi:hypothetical protein NXS98_07070 [Fontisphaera persica]|uniref:hypothetical protein n=1 Tax=Fontisphaera persica TaxID=2974023 RepID=UPI0024BFD27B|nr:hypothetical protein [Fontisphaera persica]WCJ60882.1 hypothetical protein NXS98_07070 [Fontisphaera persica]
MKSLSNRALERQLRQLVRQEVRQAPALKKARAKVGGRKTIFKFKLGFLLPVILAMAILFYPQDLKAAQGLLIILMTGAALVGVRIWSITFYESLDNYFYARLPVPNYELFAHCWRRFLRYSLGVHVVNLAMACVVVLRFFPWREGCLGLLVWGALQWGVMVAFTLLLQDPRPPLPFIPNAAWCWAIQWINRLGQMLVAAMFWVVFVGFFAMVVYVHKGGVDQVMRWLAAVGEWLGVLLPWGWPTVMIHEVAVRHNWLMLLMVLLLAGWFYSGFRSLQFLKAGYAGPWVGEDPLLGGCFWTETPSGEEAPSSTSAAELADEPGTHISAPAFPLPPKGVSAFTEYLLQRQFLRHHSWSFVGWLERLIFRRLTPRQELVMQILLLFPPRWSVGWRHAWVIAAVTGAVIMVWPAARYWAVGIGALLIAASAWPFLGGQWPGLRAMGGFVNAFSFVSFYPVAFREIARSMMVCNVIRMLAATPIWLTFAAMAGWLLQHPIQLAVGLAVKLILWGVAIQPTVMILRVASQCGDDRRFPTLAKTVPVFWFIVLVCFSAAILLMPVWGVSLVLLVLIHGGSWLFFWGFRRRFERMKFDWSPAVMPTDEVADG